MATPNEKLANSLTSLRALQQGGRHVFQSTELSRVHRERLLQHGVIQKVIKGWIILASPGARAGDSTPWYASFWEFCARYCRQRFGEDWHLSPEQSIFLLAENTVIPTQAVVSSPRGTNNKIDLLFGSSLFDLKESEMPPASDLIERGGLRLFSPEAALVRVSETFFNRNPIETGVVLAGVRDASDVLRRLLEGGHSVVAGRLAGAFRRFRRPEIAGEILTTMRAAGYDVRETDPFAQHTPVILTAPAPPIVSRIHALWESMRSEVLNAFPASPGLPKDRQRYLGFVDESYRNDAYHSLSIEGYSVSAELIERVRAGNWNPDTLGDERDRDALAARGYWQAFQAVKANVAEIIAGANAGSLIRNSHREWYRELFQPCVAAGLIGPAALAGYRNDAVYLRTSRYVPPRWEAVRDAMPAFFDLLEKETEPGVRAVLGHWLFGYIHPYPDGNGRMARFLMNAMLASGGYPWTVIRVEDRALYLAALDSASVNLDIRPFATFIAERARLSMEEALDGGGRP
jgi:fido (protein-threonine AMPylation protein)